MSRISDAVAWNDKRHSDEDTRGIEEVLGAPVDGVWDEILVGLVMDWQQERGLKVDGKVGSKTLSAMRADRDEVWRALDDEEIDKILAMTVEVEAAGAHNPYAAANRDAEFEGWFDQPKKDADGNRLKPAQRAEQPNSKPHWASKYAANGGTHVGLSWGIIQFTQDGGALGRVLARANAQNSTEFEEVFGEHADELFEVVTAKGKGKRGNGARSPRVQPVGGSDLWREPWLGRFKDAATRESFRRAQRHIARGEYFEPAIEICKEYGFSGQGDLAVAFDMCVQYGPGGARKRFRAAGKGAMITDVIAKVHSKRGRERRHDLLAHAEVWVHYEDLVMCA